MKKSKKLKIDTIFDALSRGAIGFARSRSVGELQVFEKLVVVEKPIFFKLHFDFFLKNPPPYPLDANMLGFFFWTIFMC